MFFIQKMINGEKINHETSNLSKREWNELIIFGFTIFFV